MAVHCKDTCTVVSHCVRRRGTSCHTHLSMCRACPVQPMSCMCVCSQVVGASQHLHLSMPAASQGMPHRASAAGCATCTSMLGVLESAQRGHGRVTGRLVANDTVVMHCTAQCLHDMQCLHGW